MPLSNRFTWSETRIPLSFQDPDEGSLEVGGEDDAFSGEIPESLESIGVEAWEC